uniref:Uncharacterized protein n=1 Tax=Arundo donax TaxID=35708 RepID=A0A0A9BG60_ARUDO
MLWPSDVCSLPSRDERIKPAVHNQIPLTSHYPPLKKLNKLTNTNSM